MMQCSCAQKRPSSFPDSPCSPTVAATAFFRAPAAGSKPRFRITPNQRPSGGVGYSLAHAACPRPTVTSACLPTLKSSSQLNLRMGQLGECPRSVSNSRWAIQNSGEVQPRVRHLFLRAATFWNYSPRKHIRHDGAFPPEGSQNPLDQGICRALPTRHDPRPLSSTQAHGRAPGS